MGAEEKLSAEKPKAPTPTFEAKTAQRRLRPQDTLWMHNLSSCCELRTLVGNPTASCWTSEAMVS